MKSFIARSACVVGILLLSMDLFSQSPEIVRSMGSDCVGFEQEFLLQNCIGCTDITWDISGPHTDPWISLGGRKIGEFHWTATGSYYVTCEFMQNNVLEYLSYPYSLNIGGTITPSVSISRSPSSSPIAYGTNVIFTASPTNGGTSPTYQWYRNNVAVSGQTAVQYSVSDLQDGDEVFVRIYSNAYCAFPNFASSNVMSVAVTYTVSSPTASHATIPFNTSTVLYAGGAGANEVYRWYSAASGGTYHQGSFYETPVLLNHATYYVAIRNTISGAESARIAQNVTVVVPPPDEPEISVNVCGPKTLSRNSPPEYVTWFWQGTDVNGYETASTAQSFVVESASEETYYIRAKATTANIWSTPVGISVATDPVDIVVDSYSEANPVVQASYRITLGPGFSVPEGHSFEARVVIDPGCSDLYNWTEEILYDQDALPTTRSRNYLSGVGDLLQSQTIDYSSGKVWLSQPLYDYHNIPSASTLPAPIQERDFIFKRKFVTNGLTGNPYQAGDFDGSSTLEDPVAVGKQPGMLGWYYSDLNDLEPNTPITSYPYARQYSPPGPDPTTSISAAPGDPFRMGTGREVTTERQLIGEHDLDHYLSLRAHFVNSSLPVVGYKFITTDPDGGKAVNFVDADGRQLASAILDGSTLGHWSYSYYNDIGQLVANVAPNGVNTGSTAFPSYVTSYRYDQLGRLIETISPDEGTSRFVYSTDGKIRFSESQVQREASPKRFSYTNYDYLGRLIESGEYTSGTYIFEPHSEEDPDENSVLNIIDLSGPMTGLGKKVTGQESYCSDYTFVEYDRENLTGIPVPPASFQENLRSQVSRTENENAITLYSYDEFGQVTRTWQLLKIADLAQVKTIDYSYDYFGNVSEVAYQKEDVDERFYHHYVYDVNQRLTEVHTSKNGTNLTLRAKYHYYLHGPLKRVELFNGNEQLQGIDYTYTINGALKTINHADPALDPGGDEDDVFGETLEYFSNDYMGADYSTGTQTISGGTDRYNGLLKAMSWNSPAGNHDKQTYVYQYDDRDQLTSATWGLMTGSDGSYGFSPGSLQAFREAVPAYDKNGNIQSLNRKGKEGISLADYEYHYQANTNRLDNVSENSSVFIEYSYNSIGQVTRVQEGEDKDHEIRYNAYGLVAEIRDNDDANNILQSYHYDDRGHLLQKVYYSGGVAQLYTTYVSDVSGSVLAIYVEEIPTLEAPDEVPIYGAGRLAVYKPSANSYFYEVNDHLGNVRAVIGVAETETYSANFETLSNTDFENYSRYNGDEMDHTDADDDVYTYSQLLNGGYAGRIGVARSFQVTPGDVLKVEAYGKYRDLTGSPWDLDGFAAALTSAFGLQAGPLGGDPGTAYGALNSYGAAIADGLEHHDDILAPKAYINILLFDKNFIFVDAAYAQLSEDAEQVGTTPKVPHDYLMREVTITEAGYAYVFVSNENLERVDVHFDDVKITHTHSNIVGGADYYPFGLAMDGREIDDEPYRWGYQGQYAEKDTTTGWNEFELRFYDARIARWLSSDPYGQFYSPYVAMGNVPHMSVDPDGGFAFNLEKAIIYGWAGATLGGIVDLLNGNDGSKGALIGFTAGFAIGGVNWSNIKLPGLKMPPVSPGVISTGGQLLASAGRTIVQQNVQKGHPTIFVSFAVTPKRFDKQSYFSQLHTALVANGFDNSLEIKEYSLTSKLSAWWDDSPTGMVSFNHRYGNMPSDAGGFALLNNPNSIIIYPGLDGGYGQAKLETWYYVNATLHEIGHAFFGFEGDTYNVRKSVMDYKYSFHKGQGFNAEELKTIHSSVWGARSKR